MTYRVGQELEAPRGGMPVKVAYYEYLAGAARGAHGWYDTNPDCRRVFQTG